MNEHTKDLDCTLDEHGEECTVCGVWHGDPCLDCGGRGFHMLMIDEQSGEPIRDKTCEMLYRELMAEFDAS